MAAERKYNVSVMVDSDVWREFRAECLRVGVGYSYVLAALIEMFLKDELVREEVLKSLRR